MKYFTNEFYDSIDNAEDRRDLYSLQCKMYWDDFDSCSSRLPKPFVKYYKKFGFHDDILNNLQLVKRRTKNRVHIDVITQFNNAGRTYEIHYYDVIKFESSIDGNHYAEIGDYLDGEILSVDDHYLSHEFGFYSDPGKILIHFQKLSFKEIT